MVVLLQDHQEVLHYGKVCDLLPAFRTAHVKKTEIKKILVKQINIHVLRVINKVSANLSASEVRANSAPRSTLLSDEERRVTSAWRWKMSGSNQTSFNLKVT